MQKNYRVVKYTYWRDMPSLGETVVGEYSSYWVAWLVAFLNATSYRYPCMTVEIQKRKQASDGS